MKKLSFILVILLVCSPVLDGMQEEKIPKINQKIVHEIIKIIRPIFKKGIKDAQESAWFVFKLDKKIRKFHDQDFGEEIRVALDTVFEKHGKYRELVPCGYDYAKYLGISQCFDQEKNEKQETPKKHVKHVRFSDEVEIQIFLDIVTVQEFSKKIKKKKSAGTFNFEPLNDTPKKDKKTWGKCFSDE